MSEKKIKTAAMITGIAFLASLTVLTFVVIGNENKKGDFIGLDSDHLRTINVSGEGKVYAVPDTAKISFSIVTDDENSEVALDENNEKASGVVNYLKEQEVEEENIQTTGISVQPIYERDPELKKERQIVRYEVTNSVKVELKELDRADTIIDGAIRAGANRVNNFQLLVGDEEELKTEAIEKAIQEAREKAEKTTKALNVKIGRVISFSESRDYSFPITQREMVATDEEGGAPDMPIEPGENEIVVNVSIEFEII